jgi:hypothetical protein
LADCLEVLPEPPLLIIEMTGVAQALQVFRPVFITLRLKICELQVLKRPGEALRLQPARPKVCNMCGWIC